ncbi:hypothetical protein OI25_6046 [Paraburkholderia fungorum]|uniref:Uncharacterized protein n=1 Tax=Paraburkholderia fungorum TaxID=134537 RepID=A0AAU8TQC5_9BURK|nr:hypothetical protein OI25_6046 [Paraburkholderia fungorum]
MAALPLLWFGGATRAVREPGLTAVCSAGAFTERFPRFASKLARGAKVHEESGGGAVFLAWCFVASKRAAGSSAMGRS